MRIDGLRQHDGTTCGPSVAVVAGALLDPACRSALTPDRFAEEQVRVHELVNRGWPRVLGTTPMGMARAITLSSGGAARYRWRLFHAPTQRARWRAPRSWWGRRDRLTDALAAVDAGRPVAMLIGRFIPRHWVLIVETSGEVLQCYEPSAGVVRAVAVDAIRRGRMTGVGYPRVFALVLPRPSMRSAAA